MTKFALKYNVNTIYYIWILQAMKLELITFKVINPNSVTCIPP